jgi:hypothetical protein
VGIDIYHKAQGTNPESATIVPVIGQEITGPAMLQAAAAGHHLHIDAPGERPSNLTLVNY